MVDGSLRIIESALIRTEMFFFVPKSFTTSSPAGRLMELIVPAN